MDKRIILPAALLLLLAALFFAQQPEAPAQPEEWEGMWWCPVEDFYISGNWSMEISGGKASGNLTSDSEKGTLDGYVEGNTVYATAALKSIFTGARLEFEWVGIITENETGKTIASPEGSTCKWDGEKKGGGAGVPVTPEGGGNGTTIGGGGGSGGGSGSVADCGAGPGGEWTDGREEGEGPCGEGVPVTPEYGNVTGTANGSEINITYAPVCTENCTKIVFIQIVCTKAIFDDGSEGDFNPSDMWPPWAGKDADVVDGGKFCTVDYIDGEKDPYYNGDDKADHGAKGKHAGNLNATMTDRPRIPNKSFDYLEKKFGKNVSEVVLSFEVCALCASGEDEGKYYGCMEWTYRELKKGAAGPRGAAPGGAHKSPSKKFGEAVGQWAKNHGFPMPKRERN